MICQDEAHFREDEADPDPARNRFMLVAQPVSFDCIVVHPIYFEFFFFFLLWQRINLKA